MAVYRRFRFLYLNIIICVILWSDIPHFIATGVQSNSTTPTTVHLDETIQHTTPQEPTESTPNVDRTPVYIGGFFSHGGTWDSSGILPAVQMAIDHINERQDILPDYELRMVWNDTQCEANLGTRVLFYQLFHPPQKLLLIGDGCSTSTRAIAGTSYFWNLNTVSYAALHPGLSNRENYPYFYRTLGPDTTYNPARVKLMKEFGWKRMATIHGRGEIFSLTVSHLLSVVKNANISVISSETFASEDPRNQLQYLKRLDAKIITLNMYETKARRVLCEAYREGMTGPGYVWMILGWYHSTWFEDDDPTVRCSPNEMRKAAESSRYISTESLQLSTSQVLTIANITAAQYVTMYKEYLKRPQWSEYTYHRDGPFGYDAAWAIGLMLHKAAKTLHDGGRTLDEFTYDDTEMGQLFFTLLNETSFIGVSGQVTFRNADRVGPIQIRQYQDGCATGWTLHGGDCFHVVEVPAPYTDAVTECQNEGWRLSSINDLDNIIRLFEEGRTNEGEMGHSATRWYIQNDDLTDNLTCTIMELTGTTEFTWSVKKDCDVSLPYVCKTKSAFQEKLVAVYLDSDDGGTLEWISNFTWSGGTLPLDYTPSIELRINQIPSTIYIVLCTFSGLGIILTLFFFAFNIMYRNQRFVKMSSPYINNLIIVGILLVYCGVFPAGLENSEWPLDIQATACQIRIWTLSIGFVLSFGSMFSKMWRVYKVVAFKKPKRVMIRDRKLYFIVVVLVLLDIILLLVWHIMDPIRAERYQIDSEPNPQQPNQQIITYCERCTCDHALYWSITLVGFKALLLIIGVFLAWETRKVSIPGLNDSKTIGYCIYNISILAIIGLTISYTVIDLDIDPATGFVFTSWVSTYCTTSTLLILFLPKIKGVHKPSVEPIEGNHTFSTMNNNTAGSSHTNYTELSPSEMKIRLKKAESEVEKLKGLIQRSETNESHG